MSQCTTPVLFTIFNRPETTRVVFDEIRNARPERLFIVADGPREGKKWERERCEEARRITENVDWDCEVLRNYAERNLGCAQRAVTGFTWFFEHVSEGIILEDDDLPHPDFFPYCTEMLRRYRDINEVMLVGANNFQREEKWGPASYYFSAFPLIWGFAMWKRTWDTYDASLHNIGERDIEAAFQYYFFDVTMRKFYMKYFKRVKEYGAPTTWDAQFFIGLWARKALSIVPNANLVSNIGFGDAATHAQHMDSIHSCLLTEAIIPLIHPSEISLCREADAKFYREGVLPFSKKVVRKLSRILYS